MGCLLAQLSRGPVKEVVIEYAGDFQSLNLSPVRTAVVKGLLTPIVKDTVNFVNADVMARERGIKVTETTLAETEEYLNLITVSAVTEAGTGKVGGRWIGARPLTGAGKGAFLTGGEVIGVNQPAPGRSLQVAAAVGEGAAV